MARATVVLSKTETEVALAEKTFKSGKRGFWGQSKVAEEGKRYQVQVLVVEIA